MNLERLATPAYTLNYKCNKCEHEMILDVSVYIPISERPRELHQCNKCGSEDIKIVPVEVSGSIAFIPPDRLGRMKTPDGFRDVLHRIADRTPGGHVMKDHIR